MAKTPCKTYGCVFVCVLQLCFDLGCMIRLGRYGPHLGLVVFDPGVDQKPPIQCPCLPLPGSVLHLIIETIQPLHSALLNGDTRVVLQPVDAFFVLCCVLFSDVFLQCGPVCSVVFFAVWFCVFFAICCAIQGEEIED